MQFRTVTLKLSDELLSQTAKIAGEDDITVGHLVRQLLSREITRRSNAKPPVRADEQLIAPLRALLATDLAEAPNWELLQTRLKNKGYILREAGGGLALHRWPDDLRICKASELGFSYGSLMRRLNTPFPGHSHTWLYAKAKGRTDARPSEDFQVTESF